MMKKLVNLLSLVVLLTMVSCAEEESFDLTQFQQEAFDKWMAKYYPEAEKQTSGLYLQWIERSGSGQKLLDGYWMEINYTGMNDQGDYYISRSPSIAKQLGYFSYTTRYVPEYLQYSVSTLLYDSNIPIGEVLALREMEEGDSVRVFMPNGFGYTYGFTSPSSSSSSSSSIANVYSPQGLSLAAAATLILDLKLNRIVRDPLQYDRDRVEKYAMDSMGITNLRDSIAVGVYLQKLEENPQGDTIGMDSMVKIYYTGRFLNGFVFQTNVDSIATKYNITAITADSTSLNTRSLGSSYGYPWKNGVIQAVLHMQEGERARVVMVSEQAYGSAGEYGASNNSYATPQTSTITYIPPYTPLVYDLYVVPRGVKEDDNESEE